MPARRQQRLDRPPRAFRGHAVGRRLRLLLHDPALDQLEPVGLGQDAALDHLVVLIDGEPPRDRAHRVPPSAGPPRPSSLGSSAHGIRSRRRISASALRALARSAQVLVDDAVGQRLDPLHVGGVDLPQIGAEDHRALVQAILVVAQDVDLLAVREQQPERA